MDVFVFFGGFEGEKTNPIKANFIRISSGPATNQGWRIVVG